MISAFVMLANGVYIGSGVVHPVGDARDLVDLGAPVWLLGVFGAAAMTVGVGIAVGGERRAKGAERSRGAHPQMAGTVLVTLIAVLGAIGAACFG